MKYAQKAFDSLVMKDFSMASFEDVKTVALAMWHENFVPCVEHLADKSAQAAGYVVDKLMRFNCVSRELKGLLSALLAKLRAVVSVVPVKVRGCDKLAQNWGLMSDLKLQVRQLLEFQTRHYVHA
jgi:hypothetical protein